MKDLIAQMNALTGIGANFLWLGLLVFMRVGSVMSLLPAFGEQVVSQRVRLVLALAFTAVVAPALHIAPDPTAAGVLPLLIETVIGLMLGIGLRLFVLALQTAGAMAAQATTLSQMFGDAGPEPQPAISNLLIMAGLALAVASGLHVRVAELLILSYQILPVGQVPGSEDAAHWGVSQISHMFSLAFCLAAPFTIAALLYNVALGIINRAMPALMVSMIGAPALTAGGLVLMVLAIPLALALWVASVAGFSGRAISGAAMSEDDDDKSHEPSQKRLDDARKRGEIPKSTDLSTAAVYAGFVLVGLIGGGRLLQQFGQAGLVLLDQPDRLAPLLFGQAPAPVAGMAAGFVMAALPLFVVPMLAVLLTLIAQRAVHFAPEKLAVKWSRISPLATARQKFGREGLFEFGKSFAKLATVALILGVQLSGNAVDILASLALEPAQSVTLMLKLLLHFMVLVVITTLLFGGIDYFWQRMQHLRRNRMSRKDLTEEMKDSEGDPHVKQQRRQRGQEIATNRMLRDVVQADVVVVNPTHYAVALKWSRKGRTAPICVAKGVDEVAARIRAKAAEAGVPLQSDPPTARAIYATVEIGQQIRPEHYRAVAAAIRFAESMRKRRKVYVK